jgi:hypothetical protein
MTTVYISIGILILLGLILGFLKDRTEKTIQYVLWGISHSTKLGIYTYFILFLPGIILHELSHLFAALFLGVQTGEIRIIPVKKDNNEYQLGEVKTAETSPIKESIIGLAPLIVGMLSILFIIYFGLQIKSIHIGSNNYFAELVKQFIQINKLQLFLSGYGIFCFSNTMFISDSDKRAWIVFPLLLLLIISLIYFIGIFPNEVFIKTILLVINTLSAAFIFSIVIDTVFFMPMGIVNYLLFKK